MRRLWLLTFLMLPQLGWGQDAGALPPADEARKLMLEGLEREVPPPAPHPRPEWPRAQPLPQPVPPRGPPTSKERLEKLSEKVKNDAAVRARSVAEERRTVPDNQPGVGQSRTRAAKAQGPVKPRPPRP